MQLVIFRSRTIDVYANKASNSRKSCASALVSSDAPSKMLPAHIHLEKSRLDTTCPPFPQAPRGVLRQLAREIDSSIRFL